MSKKKRDSKGSKKSSQSAVRPPARRSRAPKSLVASEAKRPAPDGPPLEGEELSACVIDTVSGSFRNTEQREEIRRATKNAPHDQIEAVLRAAKTQETLEPIMKAFVIEQSMHLLRALYVQAQNDKAAAWRILMEWTPMSKLLARASGESESKSPETTAFEKLLFDRVRDLSRRVGLGGGKPEEPSATAIISQEAEQEESHAA